MKKKNKSPRTRSIIVKVMLLTRKVGPHLEAVKDDWNEDDEIWEPWDDEDESD